MTDLEGKVVVVTGATSGIGRAAACALARVGATVVVGARRRAEGDALVAQIASEGGTASFVATDVSVEGDLERLDGAFNNAGIELGGPLLGITQTDYRRVFDANVWGVAAAMKHEIIAMLSTGGGAIVNTSSIAGHVGIADFSLYNASM